MRSMVAASANCGQDPQWHYTHCGSAVLMMFTACDLTILTTPPRRIECSVNELPCAAAMWDGVAPRMSLAFILAPLFDKAWRENN